MKANGSVKGNGRDCCPFFFRQHRFHQKHEIKKISRSISLHYSASTIVSYYFY